MNQREREIIENLVEILELLTANVADCAEGNRECLYPDLNCSAWRPCKWLEYVKQARKVLKEVKQDKGVIIVAGSGVDRVKAEVLLDWVNTQPHFSYDVECESRKFPGGGFVTWDNKEVVAVSAPNAGPLEAIAFWRVVESLLPQGWAGDPKVGLLFDRRVSISGVAD